MSVPIFVEFRASMSDFVAKMGVANAEIDKLSAKGAGMGAKMAVGGAAAGAGVAAVGLAVGAVSVKMAGDFQQATNVLVTAAGESTKNLGLIRQGILDIATQTGTSWQGITDGVYGIEKAGYRGSDALKIMKAAAQGAREEGASLPVVAQAMTSIMASYHLKASDSVKVMNQMKTAAGEAKTTMEQFSGSLSTVLPLASANHISFADIAGSLASLTQHGTSADEAAQELANTMRGLSAPNQVAQKEMAQLGINAQDVSMHMGDGKGGRGLAGTLNYLSETVLHKMGPSGMVLLNTFNQSKVAAKDAATMFNAMTPAQQAYAKAMENGTKVVNAHVTGGQHLTLAQEGQIKQWATLYKSAHGFQAAIRSGTSQSQTYSEAIKKMTGGANGLNTTLQLTGESTAGTHERIKRIAEAAKTAGANVSGWDSTQKLFNVRMDEWKQGIEAAAIKLGMFLIPYVLQAMDWLQKMGSEVLPYLKQAFADVSRAVQDAWPTIMTVVKAVVGWIANTAIPDLVTAFHWVTSTALPAVESAFHTVWHAAGDAIQWFIDNPLKWIRDRIAEFQAFWKSHGQEIQDVAHTAWTFISRTVDAAWTVIWDGVLKPGLRFLTQMWGPTWQVIKDVVKTVWDLLKGIVSTGYHLIMDEIGVFLDLLDGHWSKAWDGVKKTVSDAWDGISSLVLGFISNAGHLLYDVGKLIIKGLVNGIKDSFNSVKNTLGDLTGKLTSWKGPPGKDAVLLFPAGVLIIDGLVAGMQSRYGAVKQTLGDLGAGIGHMLAKGITDTSAIVADAASRTMYAAAGAGLGGFMDGMRVEYASKVKAAATDVGMGIGGTIGDSLATALRTGVVDKAIAGMKVALDKLKVAAAKMAATVAASFGPGGLLSTIFNGAAAGGYGTDEASLATQLQAHLNALQAFNVQVKQLRASGLNDAEVQDIVGMGAGQGGALASSILASGAAGIAQLNNIQGTYDATANAIGATAAGSTYGKQIAAQEVHIHLEGALLVGGTKTDFDQLGLSLADSVRSALLAKKASGQVGALGLA